MASDDKNRPPVVSAAQRERGRLPEFRESCSGQRTIELGLGAVGRALRELARVDAHDERVVLGRRRHEACGMGGR